MSCASKHKPAEADPQLRYEVNSEALELMEEEELLNDLPEAGEDEDESEQ